MSTNLYWRKKTASDGRLPIAIKRALEKQKIAFITRDFLHGYLLALPEEQSEDRKQLEAVLQEIDQEGIDKIEFTIE